MERIDLPIEATDKLVNDKASSRMIASYSETTHVDSTCGVAGKALTIFVVRNFERCTRRS
jgi:hypothetical protein